MNIGSSSLLQFLRKNSVNSSSSSHQSSKKSDFSKQNSDQFRTPTKNILRQNFGRQQRLLSPYYSTIYQQEQPSNYTFSPYKYGNSMSNSLSESRSYDDFEQQEYKSKNYKNPQIQRNNTTQQILWPRRSSEYSNSQTSKISQIQYIQKCQQRLRKQIKNIDMKINNCGANISSMINEELQRLKQRIYKMVEDIFKDSERYTEQYIKNQQKIITEDLIYVRKKLQSQYQKITSIKHEVRRSNWQEINEHVNLRDIESTIQSLVQTISGKQINNWQPKRLFERHMISVEQILVNIVKLQEQY